MNLGFENGEAPMTFRGWHFFLLIMLCFSMGLRGQTAAATVSGRVTDSAAAIIAAASVELTSLERGTVSTAPTNQAGIYLFPSVQPGQYHVVVRSAGFKQAEVQSLVVDVGS